MRKLLAGVIGTLLMVALAGASYGVFSPGGDLAGTWNNQTVLTVNNQLRTDDSALVANGSVWERKSIPDCTDTGGNHLNYTASTNAYSCGTSGSGVAQTVATPTLTVTGFSDVSTAAAVTVKTARQASVSFSISGTSNATTFTVLTLASDVRPLQNTAFPVIIRNNGTDAVGIVLIGTNGVIQVFATSAFGAFTGSGQKQLTSFNATYVTAT